jgi:UPF0755 protein
MSRRTLIFFMVATLAMAMLVWLFARKAFQPYKGYQQTVVVRIPQHMTVDETAEILRQQRVIANAWLFKMYYRLAFPGETLKSGDYLFDRPLTIKQVLEKLIIGKAVLYKITFKEGMTVREIADSLNESHMLSADSFRRAAKNVKLIDDLDPEALDLEGYLFPDTYAIQKGVSGDELVMLMVNRFRESFTNTWRWRALDMHLSIRAVITLASLIEKESANRNEKFLISSVFHNRLRKKMLLDCDPTIIYALKKYDLYRGKLGWSELKFDSPYNTRLHHGLPPGPICNPGSTSIEAALYPENTDYLFFVAKDAQSHYFSETLKEHNRAVHEFIINKRPSPEN